MNERKKKTLYLTDEELEEAKKEPGFSERLAQLKKISPDLGAVRHSISTVNYALHKAEAAADAIAAGDDDRSAHDFEQLTELYQLLLEAEDQMKRCLSIAADVVDFEKSRASQ